MINGDTEQFLDTGWLSEAEIYYKGHIYWREGGGNKKEGFIFFIKKWAAENINNMYYKNILSSDGDLTDYDKSFHLEAKSEEELRQKFLKSPVFDGKTFWEVEKELCWLEPLGNLKI